MIRKHPILWIIAGLFLTGSLHAEERMLKQKAARMLIVGMRGTELRPDNPVVEDIRDRGVGGVILFEHNITPTEKGMDSKARLTRLCKDLQALRTDKLLISIDQEGGRVNRLKTKYGFPRTVSQAYLGKTDNEDTTRHYAGIIARTLAETGFNANFTPCVDIDVNPECPAIGKAERSFSADPETVVRHASYIIDEHRKRGILTAVKHFPGHGSSSADSHLGFTDVSKSWTEQELLPYRALLKNGECDMVMVSHVFNNRIDSVYPATLSRKTVTGLLREQLGWDGVTVTDDMHMKAISDNYSLEESLQLAINAGIDMIILSSNIPGNTDRISQQAIDLIVKSVREGKIEESRIDEAITRIDRLLGK